MKAGPAAMVIDQDAIARRIDAEVAALARPPYSEPGEGVTRYAFTEPYERTLSRVGGELERLGLAVESDPVGTLVARPGRRFFAVGSHLDSVRSGGPWDGVLGTLVGVELRRLGFDVGVVAWVEEEGAGFGEMLLGSRVAAGELDAADLEQRIFSLDDGRSFADHCRAAGGSPERLEPSRELMGSFEGWIEVHTEQGRVLEDAGRRIGVVTAIAGYLHAEVEVRGAADHAGATPMGLRHDAGLVAAEAMLAAEQAAGRAGRGTVATVGWIALEPGAINVVPGRARFTLDIRSPDDAAVAEVERAVRAAVQRSAGERGAEASVLVRGRRSATPLDRDLSSLLLEGARACGAEPLELVSGAAHDTMNVAPFAPSALVFVPCADGVSHAPHESADPADAALATEVVARALAILGRPRREEA